MGVYINDLTISTVTTGRRLEGLDSGGVIEGGHYKRKGGPVLGVDAGRGEVRFVRTEQPKGGESYLRKHRDGVGYSHMFNHKNTLISLTPVTVTLAVSVSLQSLGFVLNSEETSNKTASTAYIYATNELRKAVDTDRFTTIVRRAGLQYQSSSSFAGLSAVSGSVTTTGPYTLNTAQINSASKKTSLAAFEALFVPGRTATFIVTVIVVILIGFILIISSYIVFYFIMRSKRIEKEGDDGGAIGAAVPLDAKVCIYLQNMYVYINVWMYICLYLLFSDTAAGKR